METEITIQFVGQIIYFKIFSDIPGGGGGYAFATALVKRYCYLLLQHCLKHYSSSSPQNSNFFAKLFNNIKDEIAKNKEMKQNLEQFRAEKKKLEESDNLIKAR